MFVQVKYWKSSMSAFASSPYTYETDLPLRVFDVVCAPTKDAPEGQKAIVVSCDVAKPSFPCKKILGLWTDEMSSETTKKPDEQ